MRRRKKEGEKNKKKGKRKGEEEKYNLSSGVREREIE